MVCEDDVTHTHLGKISCLFFYLLGWTKSYHSYPRLFLTESADRQAVAAVPETCHDQPWKNVRGTDGFASGEAAALCRTQDEDGGCWQ